MSVTDEEPYFNPSEKMYPDPRSRVFMTAMMMREHANIPGIMSAGCDGMRGQRTLEAPPTPGSREAIAGHKSDKLLRPRNQKGCINPL